jgi:tRNA threonylcarbamoyl adenosine modification protein YeaZ
MNVLAIEYSSSQRSIAVLATDSAGKTVTSAEVLETGGRAANTFQSLEAALHQAGLEREQINCVAIGLGPGSYTGIRAAISVAQGWQLAAGVRVVGLPSTESIAVDAVAAGLNGKAGLVIDAQRGEFYLAIYDLPEWEETCSASPVKIVEAEPLRIASAAEVLALAAGGCTLFGPETLKTVPGLRIVPARALTLARLALEAGQSVAAETLTPVYLRQTTFVKAPKPREL